MKPTNESKPTNDKPVGAVETLLGIGELIAAVFAMQPSGNAAPDVTRRETAPIRPSGGSLDPEATRTLKNALAQFNERS